MQRVKQSGLLVYQLIVIAVLFMIAVGSCIKYTCRNRAKRQHETPKASKLTCLATRNLTDVAVSTGGVSEIGVNSPTSAITVIGHRLEPSEHESNNKILRGILIPNDSYYGDTYSSVSFASAVYAGGYLTGGVALSSARPSLVDPSSAMADQGVEEAAASNVDQRVVGTSIASDVGAEKKRKSHKSSKKIRVPK